MPLTESRRKISLFLTCLAIYSRVTPLCAQEEWVCGAADLPPAIGRIQAAQSTTGEQKVLVLLVNFQNDTRRPFSADQVRTVLGEASAFFREASYGQAWLTGDVADWITLPIDAVTNQNTIANQATLSARGAGINVDGYSRLIFAFPRLGFSWAGQGSIGGSPSKAWLNGDISLRVLVHELGHNFGLAHANAVVNGTVYDQADRYDAMGEWGAFHFNAKNKELLGWINVAPITRSGTYEIAVYENQGGETKAFRVTPTLGSPGYYLEYRQPTGFDRFVEPNVANGILIHLGNRPSLSMDMTPETASLRDPALETGRSFTDPLAGIIITPVRKKENSILVNVQFSAADIPISANAGVDQTAALPFQCHLQGNVDRAGTAAWRQVSGPRAVRMDDASSLTPRIEFETPGEYVFRLTASDGSFFSSDDVSVKILPRPGTNAFGPFQNVFNPDRESIAITYNVDQDAETNMDIYSIFGERIITLENSVQSSGSHVVRWDGRNSSGQTVGADVYLIRLRINEAVSTQKLVVVR